MKKTITALFLCIITLAMALSVSATESRFDDVPEGSWFYDAVYYAKENNLFSGTSEKLFSPKTYMTRAMLVTVLASRENIDKTQYTTSSFTDVAVGKWYFAAVEWAYRSGIVSGVGGGRFAPDKAITRQEMVAILKTYADFSGIDTTYGENYSLSGFADADTVAKWALPAVKWAVKCGFISGVNGENDTMLISPLTGATRAAVAVIMKNFCTFDFPVYVSEGKAHLTVNGNEISLYRIVYPAAPKDKEYQAAAKLCEFIYRATGENLSIVTDDESAAEYEILIGETNRENGEIDRNTLKETSEIAFTVKVVGNKLFFAGAVDAESRHGTFFSVYYFAEKYLGFDFYQDDCITCRPEAEIALENGFEFSDAPGFRSRETYTRGAWEDCLLNGGYYRLLSSIHTQGQWIDPSAAPAAAMPCLTLKANIDKVCNRAVEYFTNNPSSDGIWVSINDSTGYCTCSNCMDAYREDGSRAATIIRLCNAVSTALENAGFHNKKIITIAYNYCTIAPKVTKPSENIIVYYCTNAACGSHAYDDTTCRLNTQIHKQVTAWSAICSEMFIWDYVTDFSYCMVPMPTFYSLRQDVKFFYDNKATGIFVNGIDESTGEFDRLRGYLYSALMKNPNMSEEEYFDRLNGFIRAYYNDRKLYLREYIDIIEELTDRFDYNFNAPPSSFYDYGEVVERIPEIDKLWENAFAEAGNDASYYTRVEESYTSWLYLKQCASFDAYYTNGSETQKAAYVEGNKMLIGLITKYGICVDQIGGKVSYSETTSPESWQNYE